MITLSLLALALIAAVPTVLFSIFFYLIGRRNGWLQVISNPHNFTEQGYKELRQVFLPDSDGN